MGLFKKIKDGMQTGADAQAFAQQNATPQAGPGQIAATGGMPVDPAVLGGPSTAPLDADDPMLQPINGIGLAEYAAVSKQAQAEGVTTEEGMAAIAAQQGYDPAVFTAATKEWIDRMGKSMVVGQQFRKHLGY
jgi:hypothetical protein